MAARLFLPQAWINDGQRRRRTGIPEEVVFRSKPEIALDLVGELIGSEIQPSRCWAIANMATAGHCGRDWRDAGLSLHASSRIGAQGLGGYAATAAGTQTLGPEVARTAGPNRVGNWPQPAGLRLAALPVERCRRQDILNQNGLDPRMDGLDLAEDSSEIPETWLVFDWPQGQPEPGPYSHRLGLDGTSGTDISPLRLQPYERFQIEHILPARQGRHSVHDHTL